MTSSLRHVACGLMFFVESSLQLRYVTLVSHDAAFPARHTVNMMDDEIRRNHTNNLQLRMRPQSLLFQTSSTEACRLRRDNGYSRGDAALGYPKALLLQEFLFRAHQVSEDPPEMVDWTHARMSSSSRVTSHKEDR